MAVVYILNANKLTTDISKYSNIDKKRQEKIKKSNNTLFIKEQLGSSILLNEILENNYFLDPKEIEYIYNESGKPYLKDKNLYFSLSHSNGIVALTVSKEEVGLDIELIKPVKDALAKRIMTTEEYIKLLTPYVEEVFKDDGGSHDITHLIMFKNAKLRTFIDQVKDKYELLYEDDHFCIYERKKV